MRGEWRRVCRCRRRKTCLLQSNISVFFHYVQGRTQGVGGIGVNSPLNLIFYKNFITFARRLIAFAYFLIVNLSTYCKYHGTNLHANFKEHCKWAKEVIIRFWWEFGLSSASRNHLTTFYRPIFHYMCLLFKIVFQDSSLFPKPLSL